ncbi:hypothetical protein J5226_00460 [Lysobacter sp. K5869]|uniref:hypothetical protein n=1 Tax=Lysobacter sp. K5869 TaxID=2820808 RepID=UPI001C061AB7|nr:hypothetical protein [Lysobacter sp. K5869]QWP76920.1 hypothetical protein J5226_00460 [Lysobacter sp. K5869]
MPLEFKPYPSPDQHALGRSLLRSLTRKLIVLAVLAAALVLWAGWQYSQRQSVETKTLGDYRIGGDAVTVLLVQPDVSLDLGTGLRGDYTAQLARAVAAQLAQLGYRTRQLSARSDEERFGQVSRLEDKNAAIAHQTQTLQSLRETAAPVLRVSLEGLENDGSVVTRQRYKVELLDPRTLEPSWEALLTWREGRSQSIALLWHLRQNRLPPPLWDSLAALAVERMREDGKLPADAIH